MDEIELKFVASADQTAALCRQVPNLSGLVAQPTTRQLRSIYYDTPDQVLRRNGIALRLRFDGTEWVQTVKAKNKRHGGLHTTQESDCPADGETLRLKRIPDTALRARITALCRRRDLAPICETRMERTAALVDIPGEGRVELAIDRGEIRAGNRCASYHEVELELVSGEIAALFTLTGRLFPEGGLRFAPISKAARGYMLAADGRIAAAPAPRNAHPVPLTPEQTGETAAREVLRECFDQIIRNIDTVRDTDDPESVHQLRIGLRRFRSASALFRPVIGHPKLTQLSAEARWLSREVGQLRDLDVALSELVLPEAKACPEEPGFAQLADLLETRRQAQRDRLREVLTSARSQSFVLDLARFIETRGWLRPDDFAQDYRLSRPVKKLARRALRKRWTACETRAKGIETLSIDARHTLRKELKKLRYAVEFLSPLMPRKRTKAALKQLKRLQDVFGDLNDLSTVQGLFLAANAPGRKDPDVQRAVGRLLGSRRVQADLQWSEAQDLWHDLRARKPAL
ncbi:CHAD domain-containing protein [Fluviibacterium sp. DFM31]|uniref:CHAD domain-containing protein n=1 Tax=Meridianimarinicoccus marinus TaxID=3231483 RepID=A0ABV3L8B6_9RHOB